MQAQGSEERGDFRARGGRQYIRDYFLEPHVKSHLWVPVHTTVPYREGSQSIPPPQRLSRRWAGASRSDFYPVILICVQSTPGRLPPSTPAPPSPGYLLRTRLCYRALRMQPQKQNSCPPAKGPLLSECPSPPLRRPVSITPRPALTPAPTLHACAVAPLKQHVNTSALRLVYRLSCSHRATPLPSITDTSGVRHLCGRLGWLVT